MSSSHEGTWEAFAGQIDAQFVREGFRLWRRAKVVANVKGWTVTLDTYHVGGGYGGGTTYTRIRTPYKNEDGFRFEIYRVDAFSKLGKLLGMQDIDIGHPQFDAQFVIKGNDASKARALFANPGLRELIERQSDVTLQVRHRGGDEGGGYSLVVRFVWRLFRPPLPKGVDELHLEVRGTVTDVRRLRSLYELFVETLNQLSHLGSASPVTLQGSKP